MLTCKWRPRRSTVMPVAVGLIAALALVGCGSSSSGGGSGGTTLKIGVPGTYGTMAGLYLARDKGYFSKQGLNVQIIPFKGDAAAVKAIVGGATDVNIASLAGMMEGVEQGASLKAFYGGFDQPTALEWYGKKPINWGQVNGTKWGVSSPGSETDALTRYLLVRHHVNLSSVHVLSTGGSAGDLSALKSGEVDYGIMSPELGVLAQKQDGANVVARMSDLFNEFPFHVIYAKPGWLSSHQDVTRKFLRALAQGNKLALDNHAAGSQEIAKLLKIPPSVATGTYATNINSHLHPNGQLPDPTSMNQFWQVELESGLLKKRLPESQWLDPKWINSYQSWVK